MKIFNNKDNSDTQTVVLTQEDINKIDKHIKEIHDLITSAIGNGGFISGRHIPVFDSEIAILNRFLL